ncbi:MAG: aldo/keto reductase [Lentisphaerae bacterium]|nr:aldo/keto reductase [Lentisphaerota bacterium]MBT4818347.1 aldo/keto reductase [Lentisphaerota bacterium]MBT5609058.1 aldo/keto reductase [Lentisphaerota bacterium]MBT7053847.1 aldo/keto reductase [Lentisphaerota bacterium]MBT7842456.1 aldo/keto reductase [Lentisphaerota bacterium]
MSLTLPKRPLGKTGLDVSLLGLGGFHQVEVTQDTIEAVVDRYLTAGGNYVETATGYGRGASETKLGRALAGRRDQIILATKAQGRTRDAAWQELNESLERLQTDHLDVWFFHNIGNDEHLEATAAPDGALAAFKQAKAEGLVRHIGVSSHWPMMYVKAAERLPIDVALIWGNYLDFCNFPEIPNTVLPALREKGVGVLFMKPLADGFLYRSPRMAFRYAMAQDADGLVSGFNSVEMLEEDLAACCAPTPVSDEEIVDVLRNAPELGTYVCRQCRNCTVLNNGSALKRIFELEGKVDRQMDSRRPVNAAEYALRERLKGWFGTKARAQDAYETTTPSAEQLLEFELAPCRYGIDIPRKLRLAHSKLARSGRIELL